MNPRALAIAQHNLMVCPISHNPKHKSYVPPYLCPALARLIENAPALLEEAEIVEEQLLADRLLECE